MSEQTVQFQVPAVHCEGCVTTIGMALRLQKGVLRTSGNAKARSVLVTFDPDVTAEPAIREAMARAGYRPASGTEQDRSQHA